MASNAIKRILKKDIKSIQTQKLNDLGIYVEFNESNMLEAVAMILGPPDVSITMASCFSRSCFLTIIHMLHRKFIIFQEVPFASIPISIRGRPETII